MAITGVVVLVVIIGYFLYVGVPMKTIQRIVGHATLEMTMNVYTHVINPDESPYVKYFFSLAEDVKKRPTDFWCFDTA